MILVDGILMRDAEHRVTREHVSTLRLLVETQDFMPFELHVPLGTDPSDAVRADKLVAEWRKGDSVEFAGRIERTRTDHDIAAFIVGRVTTLNVRGVAFPLPSL